MLYRRDATHRPYKCAHRWYEELSTNRSNRGSLWSAVISGSGNAAALAFNGAVTPHAADFGYGIMQLGSMAQIGAGIGRSMSPVAGAGIIIAGLAGINPMEMAKRNAVPCIIATIVIMLLLL